MSLRYKSEGEVHKDFHGLTCATVARESIVAKRDIKAGERFTEDNLTIRRTGTGLSPMCWDEIIGS